MEQIRFPFIFQIFPSYQNLTTYSIIRAKVGKFCLILGQLPLALSRCVVTESQSVGFCDLTKPSSYFIPTVKGYNFIRPDSNIQNNN